MHPPANRPLLPSTIAAVLCILCVAQAVAQAPSDFPKRPLRMVVPYPPGGSTDIVGRIVAAKLSESLGQQVIVDNRPGAGGNVGTDAVAKAPPDGHTLLMSSVTTLAIGASLYSALPYDLNKDLEPVALVGSVPFVLLVNSSIPARTVRDLVTLAKEKPGQLNFGSAGTGTSAHFAGEMFKMMSKTDMLPIPYKGGAPLAIDLVGGQVMLAFNTAPPIMPHIQSGRVRAIAVTMDKRVGALPDVPTIAESGVPGYQMSTWYGAVIQTKTPRDIVVKLNQEMIKALSLPDIKERMAGLGADVVGNTMEEFAALIKVEVAKYTKVAHTAGIVAD